MFYEDLKPIEYVQEYRHIKNINDFKNNYIINHASYTFDYKLFNKILKSDLMNKYNSNNLQDVYINNEYDNNNPYNKKEFHIDEIFNDLKFINRLYKGCFIFSGEWPQGKNPQPYEIYQVINIIYDYDNIETYKNKKGYIIGRPHIKTFECKQLTPHLILEYREEDTRECKRIYKYTKDNFINNNKTYEFTHIHPKYVYNSAPYIYFIPNMSDYNINNSIFV